MASGCVPVISDLPGPVELVADCGIVTPRLDDAALAQAIASLRDDPDRVASLAERARARAADLTWERCVERYLAVFQRTLAMHL